MQVTKEKFKRLIDDLGGHAGLIAEELGMNQQSISNILSDTHPAELKKRHIYMLIGLKHELKGRKLI